MPEIAPVIALLALLVLFGGRWLFPATTPAACAQIIRYAAVGALVLLGIIFAISGRDFLDLPVGALIIWLMRGWFARGFPGLSRLWAWLEGKPKTRPDGEDTTRGQAKSAGMTKTEAWQVLGLEPGADRAAVQEAHRNLIMKLHPDHGGSTYLARQINAARDILLEGENV